MNLGLIITITLYLLITGYFLYKFFKNEMSFKDTILDIKKSLFFCCLKNKKEIEETIGEERTKEIQENLEEINDCKAPAGFPFDICFGDNLMKEDIVLREKLLKILKNRKNVVLEGGKEKLIIPLEATLFLTKSLNPLVNEYGEIQIIVKHKQLSQKLQEVMFLLKNKGEVIYEEKELINSIKGMIDKVNNTDRVPKDEKEIIKKKEKILEGVETIIPEQEDFPPEEELQKQIIKETEEFLPEIREIPDTEKEIINNEKKENSFEETEEDPFGGPSLDMTDLNSLLEEELSDLDFEEEESQTDIISFYKELEYKIAKIEPLNFEDIENSIKKTLSNDSVISVFFRNLAKTKFIIFNENKTVVYVDQFNVYFAISKMFGLDFKKYIDKFKSLKLKEMQKLNKGLSIALELYLSDIRTGKLEVSKEIIEKENELFYSFGFNFQTNAFKTGLKQGEFDFFRSFPYNNEYNLKGNIQVEENLPKLVTSIEEVEIK